MAAQTPDNHLYLTDAEGRRTHIVLTLEEYEALLEEAWHRQVIAERRGDETYSLEDLQRELER
ncbi:hypothetical protein [Meiothermus ruber]|jgi:hypothetical protein|uniref:Uncharacterized protein n=1 Tax=Meiothermus ruber (strain ATCC 35948 / DSM 1279 / VKM B-1258 / 21) TaxID=504728 RepID=D3PPE0_MEIRD|nr:hypothetical protein [Meiothermus ruber]ADD27549.1 hypothetical protein Mrub_0783 [Meiothermus ruber DSM 1279]AGK04012.1 hypothetical protein K649_03550 [Meiothermus ruber DSM 1279]MCL6529865.1 hypothetical protein [Meiothermus ruber]GAO74473.1 putative uncharacterized protein [Meiothermus ruber H328]